MTHFCRQHDIHHEVCGEVVFASNSNQAEMLRELAKSGHANGLKDLSFLSKEALRKREPMVLAYEVLLVPEEGIADYKSLIHKLIELIKQFGAEVKFNTPVFRIEQMINGKVRIESREELLEYDLLISCNGLHSDRTYKNFTG